VTEAAKRPRVAFLHSGDLLEDWLDGLAISFDAFRNEMVGSWMFGYVQALDRAGVDTVLFCVSQRVREAVRFKHAPTGATICVLPNSTTYSALRWVRDWTSGVPVVGAVARAVTAYAATPLNRLRRELRRDGCRVLLVQEYETPRFDVMVVLGCLAGFRVFAVFQGGHAPRTAVKPLRTLTVRAAAGLVVAASEEATRVSADYDLPSTRIARILNPLDLTHWFPTERVEARALLGIPTNARVAVWHGAVALEKGLDVLVEAWRGLEQARPARDLRLLIIGSGEDSAKLNALIALAGVRGVVRVDEWVHDRAVLRNYLSSADVFVFPSRSEGFALAPVEAMACGLPLVASDVSGIPDLLQNGERSGGVIVPNGGRDAVALAAALGRLLDDQEVARELGARARENVENRFSLERVGAQLKAFLLAPS
jgi:starch synthase